MEKKINLEEILDKVRCIDGNPDNGQLYDGDLAKVAMLEFGKQLLELAAENAITHYTCYICDNHEFKEHQIVISSECYKCGNDDTVVLGINKQSILDTINQVK